jgi:signal transduction histidine kinase
MARRAVVLVLMAAGIAVGLISLAVARSDPGYWFADRSLLGGLALLGTGWALIGCGLVSWLRRRAAFGALIACAGLAWFLVEWNNPGIGSSLAFTIGLCLYAACPPLAAHALLVYPGGLMGGIVPRATLVVAYCANLLLLGLLPALVFDPEAEGCGQCPANLLLVESDGALGADIRRLGVWVGLLWAIVAAVLLVHALTRMGAAVRPVLLAGAAYVGLVGLWFTASLDRGYLAAGSTERRLWLCQAAALVAVSLGVAWAWQRARRARTAVAGLIVELAQAPPAGGLRDLLADMVGDESLVLAYALEEDRLVDARGESVELPAGLEETCLARDGHPIAVLGHRPGLLADEQLVGEVTRAARLVLENERLQAEVRARLEDLRASRARIVETADAERMRLEHDLHDGAQQRLVALSLSLGMLRARLGEIPELSAAEMELRTATQELRELAHGLFPAVLTDEGLAAAVEALAEDSRIPIRIHGLPETRCAAPVETAAYTAVAEAARAATGAIDVRAKRTNGTLVVEVESDAPASLDLVALEDRVGALDGRLCVERLENGGVTIHVELPCGL